MTLLEILSVLVVRLLRHNIQLQCGVCHGRHLTVLWLDSVGSL